MTETQTPQNANEATIGPSRSTVGLAVAVLEYRDALNACDNCTTMLLSNGCDPVPAQLMAVAWKARTKMFDLAEKATANV